MPINDPYRDRPSAFVGVRECGPWRLKVHDIAHPGGRVEAREFEQGVELALSALPAPALHAGRPGVGFLVRHQGTGVAYVVLCWWGRENELPIRVFVREEGSAEGWRATRGDESVCVWDLEVIWREREAYVTHVLTGGRGDVGAYLAAH